ncbi:acyltransferase [Chromobacterium vaccinii]|uniref:acyltransferase n=1 Tax=Chromobacterium vaccinii TaxID=1108595 RepID=UPI000E18BB7C|nr:hypothetical protein [Chromobacterium vaccinii]SUX30562.1 Galactoside O-acetyltransferase [Chromobacterium vaccinii]
MKQIIKIAVSLLIFLFPVRILKPLLCLLGYRIGRNVSVGFSLIIVDKLVLDDGARIGHGNMIFIRRLILRSAANVNRANLMSGRFSFYLDKDASIGNRNKIIRGPSPTVVDWGATLKLGEGARITADHLLDCTRSIFLGAYTILAGSGSQIWSHGYVHDSDGPGRYRIDGRVSIGNNVYIGSRCIINLGVSISPSSTVGAGAIISKSLLYSGFYVSAPLRFLPGIQTPDRRHALRRMRSNNLCEIVYFKDSSPHVKI